MRQLISAGVIRVIVLSMVVGALLLAAAFIDVGYPLGFVRRTFVSAEYDRMHFGGEGSEFGGFVAGGIVHDDRIPAVYIKMTDGAIVYLPDMTENMITPLADKVEQNKSLEGKEYTSYSLGRAMRAWFSEGRIIMFSFYKDAPFQVSPTRDGEFISLPVTKRKMIEVFGRPKRYTYSHPKPV